MAETLAYSAEELELIRKSISGQLGEQSPRDEFEEDKIPGLAPLSSARPGLLEKVRQDERVEKLGEPLFYPGIYEHLPEACPDGFGLQMYKMEGWSLVVCNLGDTLRVLEPLENSEHEDAARAAGEMGIGPRVYSVFNGYLVEELFPGVPLVGTRHECQPTDFYRRFDAPPGDTGYLMGEKLGTLHKEGILYRNCLPDDSSRDTWLFNPEDPAQSRILGFGQATRRPLREWDDWEVGEFLFRVQTLKYLTARNEGKLPELRQETRRKSFYELAGAEAGNIRDYIHCRLVCRDPEACHMLTGFIDGYNRFRPPRSPGS
ncbi:MAG: hypothetical protein ACE5FW_01165 [Candidatus Aenigmatarchaeota archaeon]